MTAREKATAVIEHQNKVALGMLLLGSVGAGLSIFKAKSKVVKIGGGIAGSFVAVAGGKGLYDVNKMDKEALVKAIEDSEK